MLIRSKSIDEIAHEIAENLQPFVFETTTDDCYMDVIEYYLVINELSKFCYYEQFFWCEFKDNFPEKEGYYWFTVLTNDGEKKVILAKWYNKNSFTFWKKRFKKLIAWKPCILPEIYRED